MKIVFRTKCKAKIVHCNPRKVYLKSNSASYAIIPAYLVNNVNMENLQMPNGVRNTSFGTSRDVKSR